MPGIVFLFGLSCWAQINDLYHKLAKLNEIKIKWTLAYSIHELAKMLGSKITNEELFPFCIKFFDDPAIEVW